MELTKALAEVAITGMFEGMQREAEIIVSALQYEPVNDEAKLSLQALVSMSSLRYQEAVELLAPWCHTNDTAMPHAFLALSLWKTDQLFEANQLCESILNQCNDSHAIEMAEEIQQQLEAQ
ncbi:MAG: hypothetical protein HWE26_17595 [Alteromonadaceae bacterium]|nr:hypothetical protein [Alteromonadaceae bacterium]